MLGTNRTNSEWNEERFALLLELNGKMSISGIAATINAQTGSSFTKNSIIGKRAREGLLGERPKRQGTPRPRKERMFKMREPLAFDDLFKPLEEPPVPAEFLGKTLLELEPGECRYPSGDRPYLFCGQPVREESSYCPACHALCHEPMTPAKSRDRAKIIRYLETLT